MLGHFRNAQIDKLIKLGRDPDVVIVAPEAAPGPKPWILEDLGRAHRTDHDVAPDPDSREQALDTATRLEAFGL
jgi:hypothetical protein